MNKISALIFDYGGTLDTGGCHWARFIWHAYEQVGINIGWENFKTAYIFAERVLDSQNSILPDDTFRQTLQKKLQIQLSWLRQNGLWRVADTLFHEMTGTLLTVLYNKVANYTFENGKVLGKLHARFPMALVTNFYGNISTVLREFNISECFDHVVESANVGVRKPDKKIFQLGIEALATMPGEVLVVGDSIRNDIMPAKELGCTTAWIKGEAWDDDACECQQADFVISDIRQLLTLFEI